MRRVAANKTEENDPWSSNKDPEGFPGLRIRQSSKEMGVGRTVSTLGLGKSLEHPETAECPSKLNIVGDKANQAS